MSRSFKCFMAISKGQEIKQVSFKRFTGYADFSVVALNPTKAELEKIYGSTMKSDPVYVKDVDDNGKTVKTLRLDFIVKTQDPTDETKELLTRATFNLRKQFRLNRDQTKVQIIDKYGRTAWVTKEQYAAKEVPTSQTGIARVDKAYRAAYTGEENLIQFIRTLLNIPTVDKWEEKDGNRVITGLIDKPETAEISIENWDKLFSGDVSELREAMSYQPNNKIKLLMGVRSYENNLYQSIFTDMFLNPNTKKFTRLQKSVDENLAAGKYKDTIFDVAPLHEYKEPTANLNNAAGGDAPAPFNPFAQQSAAPAPSSEEHTLQQEADDVFSNAAVPDSDMPDFSSPFGA